MFKGKKPEIGRFKGLGEMMAAQLKETTMDPSVRTLAKITLPRSEEAVEALVETLMGRKPELRFRFIQENAEFAADDWRPPTGRTLARPGPHGRFQPTPVASADPSPPGLRPVLQGTRPGPSRRRSLKTPDKRIPLDHPRKPHRSPYVRPPHALRCKQDTGGLEG
jgi:hypothetical protein